MLVFSVCVGCPMVAFADVITNMPLETCWEPVIFVHTSGEHVLGCLQWSYRIQTHIRTTIPSSPVIRCNCFQVSPFYLNRKSIGSQKCVVQSCARNITQQREAQGSNNSYKINLPEIALNNKPRASSHLNTGYMSSKAGQQKD